MSTTTLHKPLKKIGFIIYLLIGLQKECEKDNNYFIDKLAETS
jgi:hypothetical protein